MSKLISGGSAFHFLSEWESASMGTTWLDLLYKPIHTLHLRQQESSYLKPEAHLAWKKENMWLSTDNKILQHGC